MPAYAAGLRDGMVLLGRDAGEIGNAEAEIVYRVRDGQTERVLRYLPRGHGVATLQHFELAAPLEARPSRNACARWARRGKRPRIRRPGTLAPASANAVNSGEDHEQGHRQSRLPRRACRMRAGSAAGRCAAYAMECGRISFSDTAPFASDGSFNGVARDFVDPCFLIRHPDGDLIWDLGFPDAVADLPDGIRIEALNAHATMPVTLVSQLAQLNLTPADIAFVSLSHSHGDHVGNAAMFAPTATWIVDADERAHMFRDAARASEEFSMYAPLENARTVLIEGEGRHDVFGDGAVTIIQAPGHTPGHAILLVRTANSGAVLLTGDMFHMAESRERRTVPVFNADAEQTLRSMDLVEQIAAEENARVVRQHVAEDFESLPRFPEALN